MRPHLRPVAVVATTVLLAGSLATLAAPAQAATTGVTAAVLEWTGNAEVQGVQPFGGCSYFTAGAAVPNAGSGGYDADAGAVRVVKSSGALATWATRCTGQGTTHQKIVLSGGSGSVDPATGAADVQWTGAWSVNFYGGLIPFTISDPRLVLAAGGSGQITATLSGFGGEMGGTDVEPIAPRAGVVIATITGASSANGAGFQVTPRYSGISYTAPSGGTPQNRVAAGWGAWPTSFVQFHELTGLASYWYSSGGAADTKKAPLPVLVRYGITSQARTTTTLAAAPAAAVSGSPVRLTAAVAPAVAGSVTFRDGARVLGTVAVAGGRATLVARGLLVGRHALQATFTPANPVAHAGSAAARVVPVMKARARVGAALVKPAVRASARAAVRASVTLIGTPSRAAGKVQVLVGKKVRATAVLNTAAKAVVTLPRLAPGSYQITVRYAGSPQAAKAAASKITLRVVR